MRSRPPSAAGPSERAPDSAGRGRSNAPAGSQPAERAVPRTGSAARSLGDWIPQVLQEMGLDRVNEGAELLAAWNDVVGPELASHCRPQGMHRGVVHATVPDSAWMQRLQMEKRRVLHGLRDRLGDDRVQDLRLRIAPAR